MNLIEQFLVPLDRRELPEYTNYSLGGYADGCMYSKSCLTCPLPECKYDQQPANWQTAVAEVRFPVIHKTRLEHGIQKAMKDHGVSRRTVHRAAKWVMQ